LPPKAILSVGFSIISQDLNIFFSLVIWFVHPLSITHLVPPEEYAYKTNYACVLGTQVGLAPRLLVTRTLGTHTFLLINVPFVRVPHTWQPPYPCGSKSTHNRHRSYLVKHVAWASCSTWLRRILP
jgi:hypothetical protein